MKKILKTEFLEKINKLDWEKEKTWRYKFRD